MKVTEIAVVAVFILAGLQAGYQQDWKMFCYSSLLALVNGIVYWWR